MTGSSSLWHAQAAGGVDVVLRTRPVGTGACLIEVRRGRVANHQLIGARWDASGGEGQTTGPCVHHVDQAAIEQQSPRLRRRCQRAADDGGNRGVATGDINF